MTKTFTISTKMSQISWVFFYFANSHFAGMTFEWAIALGAVLGVGSVIGDLIESLMKRFTTIFGIAKKKMGVHVITPDSGPFYTAAFILPFCSILYSI